MEYLGFCSIGLLASIEFLRCSICIVTNCIDIYICIWTCHIVEVFDLIIFSFYKLFGISCWNKFDILESLFCSIISESVYICCSKVYYITIFIKCIEFSIQLALRNFLRKNLKVNIHLITSKVCIGFHWSDCYFCITSVNIYFGCCRISNYKVSCIKFHTI